MSEVKCANTSCKWNKKGKCLLFAGVTQLECKYRITKTTKKGNLVMTDFLDLGLMGGKESSKKRAQLTEKYHLGFGNAKTLLQRANALGLSKKDIEEALHD